METKIKKALISAAQKAGSFIREHAFSIGTVEWKGENNPVTKIDKEAEHIIRKEISAHISANIIGEEHEKENNSSEFTVYIDPIDGTKPFIRGDFFCAVSIGVEKNEKIIAGCIYDFMRDILYVTQTSEKGGIQLIYQGKEIELPTLAHFGKVSVFIDRLISEKEKRVIGSLLADSDFEIHTTSGSIALTLALLAKGTYDTLVIGCKGWNTWDIAGGFALCKQQGYVLLDFEGNEFDYKNPVNGLIAFHKNAAWKEKFLKHCEIEEKENK